MGLVAVTLLAAAASPQVSVAVSPRVLMPPPFQPNLTITARVLGEVTEANYCAAVELRFSNQRFSFHEQDCPSFDTYKRQQTEYALCMQEVVVTAPGEAPQEPDCPTPFAPQVSWTWNSHRLRLGFTSGTHEVGVLFTFPKGKKVFERETFLVSGTEGE